MTELYSLEMIPDPPRGAGRGTPIGDEGTLAEVSERLRITARVFRNGKWLDRDRYRAELENGFFIFRVVQIQRDAETLFPQTISAPTEDGGHSGGETNEH
ncbi:hypothetical protein ACQPW1_22645 [Nocardia sp. CA-128927]|uniref:hypothetical protein n=1 Tax=Nocardia sp. CA-128927 TaxID=3239975 RepID=UPI003D9974A8